MSYGPSHDVVSEGARAGTLPFTIRRIDPAIDALTWCQSHKDELLQLLRVWGGVLLRDFDVLGTELCHEIIRVTCGEPLEYRERTSPRTLVEGHIYTSTDYPQDQEIFLHNENSYSVRFPQFILFFCQEPPATGGETPIADCRQIFDDIPDEIRSRFAERKYLYVRNYRRRVGLRWETVFQTTNRADVEAYCNASDIEFEWVGRDELRTRQVREVAALHPVTGQWTWMNHLTFFHLSTLPAAVQTFLLGVGGPDGLPNNTYYGDGEPIEPEVMTTLRSIYARHTSTFRWEKGDVLILDNMLAAHSRRPFTGQRSILTGMAGLTSWKDLTALTPANFSRGTSARAG